MAAGTDGRRTYASGGLVSSLGVEGQPVAARGPRPTVGTAAREGDGDGVGQRAMASVVEVSGKRTSPTGSDGQCSVFFRAVPHPPAPDPVPPAPCAPCGTRLGARGEPAVPTTRIRASTTLVHEHRTRVCKHGRPQGRCGRWGGGRGRPVFKGNSCSRSMGLVSSNASRDAISTLAAKQFS